jgi:hypothetical protein
MGSAYPITIPLRKSLGESGKRPEGTLQEAWPIVYYRKIKGFNC